MSCIPEDRTSWGSLNKNLYALQLKAQTADASKMKALKSRIDQLGDDVYGRPEKLLIFTSLPVVSVSLTIYISILTLAISQYLRSEYSAKETLTKIFRGISLNADWGNAMHQTFASSH